MKRNPTKLRLIVLTLLAWIVVHAFAVIYPRTYWMDATFAFWMLIMVAMAVFAAQRTSSAVFFRGMLFTSFIYFAGTQFEPYAWAPHAFMARNLLPFSVLEPLGPGAERTYSILTSKLYFVSCCNIAFILGGIVGWAAMIFERRANP